MRSGSAFDPPNPDRFFSPFAAPAAPAEPAAPPDFAWSPPADLEGEDGAADADAAGDGAVGDGCTLFCAAFSVAHASCCLPCGAASAPAPPGGSAAVDAPHPIC